VDEQPGSDKGPEVEAAPPSRAEADQAQHLGHGDSPAKLLVIDARHEASAEGYVLSGLGGLGTFLARWARYDLPRIFRRMAPSTTRSRKAMARGGSPK